jgi:hypothetical protein
MNRILNTDKLINRLLDDIEIVKKEYVELHKQVTGHIEMTSGLSSFICNTRTLLGDLVKSAVNEQKTESLNYVIDLIESGEYDG